MGRGAGSKSLHAVESVALSNRANKGRKGKKQLWRPWVGLFYSQSADAVTSEALLALQGQPLAWVGHSSGR